jgi:hypothetical protein
MSHLGAVIPGAGKTVRPFQGRLDLPYFLFIHGFHPWLLKGLTPAGVVGSAFWESKNDHEVVERLNNPR